MNSTGSPTGPGRQRRTPLTESGAQDLLDLLGLSAKAVPVKAFMYICIYIYIPLYIYIPIFEFTRPQQRSSSAHSRIMQKRRTERTGMARKLQTQMQRKMQTQPTMRPTHRKRQTKPTMKTHQRKMQTAPTTKVILSEPLCDMCL